MEPIVIERSYDAPVMLVWKAISDVDQMRKWYFDLKEFKAEIGFEFSFNGGPDGRVYKHVCKITEVEVAKKLTYSWCYEGYEGISYVTFELFEEGTTTRLRLTHSGLESFPASNPDFAKTNFEKGWTGFIGKRLLEFLKSSKESGV